MRKLLRPFLFHCCTLALLAAGCGKKAAAPKIEPVQYPGWIEVKLDPDARFSVLPFFLRKRKQFGKRWKLKKQIPM